MTVEKSCPVPAVLAEFGVGGGFFFFFSLQCEDSLPGKVNRETRHLLSCLSVSQLECFPSSPFVFLCPCNPKKSAGGIKKVVRSLVQRQHERDFQSPLRGALPCPGRGCQASVAVTALMGQGTLAALPDEEHSSTRCFLLFYFYFLGQNVPPGSTRCPTSDALALPSSSPIHRGQPRPQGKGTDSGDRRHGMPTCSSLEQMVTGTGREVACPRGRVFWGLRSPEGWGPGLRLGWGLGRNQRTQFPPPSQH